MPTFDVIHELIARDGEFIVREIVNNSKPFEQVFLTREGAEAFIQYRQLAIDKIVEQKRSTLSR